MKKILLFAAVVGAVALTSCKKDHTCTCTTTYSNGDPAETMVFTVKEAKKSDAKKMCIDRTRVSGGVTETEDCELN